MSQLKKCHFEILTRVLNELEIIKQSTGTSNPLLIEQTDTILGHVCYHGYRGI